METPPSSTKTRTFHNLEETARLILFAGSDYYPKRGLKDMCGVFPSPEAAEKHLQSLEVDWWQLVDAATLKIIGEGDKSDLPAGQRHPPYHWTLKKHEFAAPNDKHQEASLQPKSGSLQWFDNDTLILIDEDELTAELQAIEDEEQSITSSRAAPALPPAPAAAASHDTPAPRSA